MYAYWTPFSPSFHSLNIHCCFSAVETTLRVIESGFAHLANQPTVGLYYLRVRCIGLAEVH